MFAFCFRVYWITHVARVKAAFQANWCGACAHDVGAEVAPHFHLLRRVSRAVKQKIEKKVEVTQSEIHMSLSIAQKKIETAENLVKCSRVIAGDSSSKYPKLDRIPGGTPFL